LLTFDQRHVMDVAGDGGLSSSRFSDDDRLLWWLSNDGEGTDRIGGPRGSFQDGWLGAGGSTPAWRRGRAVTRAWLGFCQNSAQGLTYL
jgi:hypothetical protein